MERIPKPEPLKVCQVRYPAFELNYDRQSEGDEAVLSRLKAAREDPLAGFAKAGKKKAEQRREAAIKAFVEQVQRKPGRSIADLVDDIDLYYSNVRAFQSKIALWLREGLIPGVRYERVGRCVLVWPVEENDQKYIGDSDESEKHD